MLAGNKHPRAGQNSTVEKFSPDRARGYFNLAKASRDRARPHVKVGMCSPDRAGGHVNLTEAPRDRARPHVILEKCSPDRAGVRVKVTCVRARSRECSCHFDMDTVYVLKIRNLRGRRANDWGVRLLRFKVELFALFLAEYGRKISQKCAGTRPTAGPAHSQPSWARDIGCYSAKAGLCPKL